MSRGAVHEDSKYPSINSRGVGTTEKSGSRISGHSAICTVHVLNDTCSWILHVEVDNGHIRRKSSNFKGPYHSCNDFDTGDDSVVHLGGTIYNKLLTTHHSGLKRFLQKFPFKNPNVLEISKLQGRPVPKPPYFRSVGLCRTRSAQKKHSKAELGRFLLFF